MHSLPVREVSVLTGNLAGSVRIHSGGGELHPYSRQFADPEVLARLRRKLERRDQLPARGRRVLAQTERGVHALADTCLTRARHHLEAACRNETRETAFTDRAPRRPSLRAAILIDVRHLDVLVVGLDVFTNIFLKRIRRIRRTTELLTNSLERILIKVHI